MTTKTSILIFYLRLSKDTQHILRYASWATLFIVCADGIVLTFIHAFHCSPVFAAWQVNIKANCLSVLTIYLASAPVNIITDLAILVLPIPVLTGMCLPQRQKAILVFTFSLGIFVTIVDVVRIYYLQQASNDFLASSLLHSTSEDDFAYNASLAFMWSAVEVNVGIVCACIPTLKPLIKKILPAMILDRASGRRGSSNTHETKRIGPVASQFGDQRRPAPADNILLPEATPLPPTSALPLSPLSDTHPGGHREDIEEGQPNFAEFLTVPTALAQDFARPHSTTHATDLPLSPLSETRPRGQREDIEEEGINMGESLTVPRGMGTASLRRNSTARTANTLYFGFVNMKVPKTMMKIRGKESFKYCIMVTTLFFLWGFSYGLLNKLNLEIATLARYSTSQTIGLSAAYFGGYIVGALTIGQWVLRHSGFRATFVSGLCIYGTGTLMFWPSAALTSFIGFILSSIVVGIGLSILETAANPFLALCGPTEYAEFRLLLAQSVQAVASLVSLVLAEKVLFKGVRIDDAKHLTLIDVQWTYLAIALFTVILALFFYYMPLPEASDADLQAQAENLEIYPSRKLPWTGTSIIFTTLVLGVMAQLCYVAAQECISEFFKPLLFSYVHGASSFKSLYTLHTAEDSLLLGHGLFAISRFIFALLCLMFRPRILLLICFLCLTIFSAFIFAINNIGRSFLEALSLLLFFFEGPIFPLVFSLTIRGMGKYTKWASAWLVASATGGSVFVFIIFRVQRLRTVQYSFVIIFTLFLLGLLFSVYLNFGGEGVRHQVDPKAIRMGGGVWTSNGDGRVEDQKRKDDDADDRPVSLLRRWSRRVSVIVQKMSFTGKKSSLDLPIVEHRERGERGS